MKRFLITLLMLSMAVFLPQCIIVKPDSEKKEMEGKWESTLLANLAGVDIIEVYDIPLKLRLTITEENEIVELLNLIEIDEEQSGEVCFCAGSLLLRFKKQSLKIEDISYYYPSRFRWKNGRWPGDAVLTPSSKSRIENWFRQRKLEPTSRTEQCR